MEPQEILRRIYNNCDPARPATDEQYIDFTEARGGGNFRGAILDQFGLASTPLCRLFTGHTGSGKSSELRRLADEMGKPNQGRDRKRLLPVIINADDYLDIFDTDTTDLLLAITAGLAETLRTTLSVELSDDGIRRVLGDASGFLGELRPTGEVNLPWFTVSLKRMRSEPTVRTKVRDALRPQATRLLDALRLVFEETRQKVRAHPVAVGTPRYDDFVILVDNLEKVRRIERRGEGTDSHRELFIERYYQLTSLGAHVLYTVPLSLVRRSGGELRQIYKAPYVLPNVKLFERDGSTRYQPGWDCFQAMLQKRLEPAQLLDAISGDGLEFLLKYSGGHTRSLMQFMQDAATYAQGVVPVPLTAAHAAVRQIVPVYSTSIPAGHWQKLVQLDRPDDHQIPPDDPDYAEMLEALTVLEYVNGGLMAEPFGTSEPWYAVNPIVRELTQFKAAMAAATLA